MSHTPEQPSHLAHHFSTAEQQRDSAKLGLWIFLVTEVLLFGGLFTAYSVYRAWNPDMFFNAHKALDLTLGTINTIILISSSLTMALAIRSIQSNKREISLLFLIVTLLLAATFLVIKYFEYRHKFHLGQLPGKFYTYTGIQGTNPHIFFTFYFMMTGLHALHIIGGMSVMSWVAYRLSQNQFSSEYYTPVELIGLYWHFVDLVWIYLFPLLYLIG
jgi:cytochrome c oxidase subunit 3